MKRLSYKEVGVLLLSILLAQAAGALGTIFTLDAIPMWYATLQKPFFSPPNWIFGPVWTLLYTFMGIAAFLVWRERKKPGAKQVLILYGIHLVLNTVWSILFFGLHNPGVALMEIIVLAAMILVLLIRFASYNKAASILMVPYLAWVCFASVLNAGIWLLNS